MGKYHHINENIKQKYGEDCVMKTFISHQTALEYWRIRRARPSCSNKRECQIALPTGPPVTAQVKRTGLTLPLHIMLNNPINRWQSPVMKQHVFTGSIPVDGFIEAEEGLMVSSPEFCFLQLAGEFALAELIELGYELCGEYAMPVAGEQKAPERGFYNRQALTNTKKLDAFIANASGVKGCKNARRATRYLLDESASPMETKLSMLLTLPYKLGGFGLIPPVLNSRIIPSKAARKTSDKNYYSLDLFWPDYNLAVEYDSDLFHTGSQHITNDSKKRNTLVSMGVVVITVTKQQLFSSSEFEKVARILAGLLGKRLQFKNLEFAVTHRELRDQLLL